MIVAVDFDGTIVEHEYPKIGKPVPGALETMIELQDRGHQLILFTMRSGVALQEAVQYLSNATIKLWGVNTNPEQSNWTQSPKAYANVYIDDAAFGCPLIHPGAPRRPYVDWIVVRSAFGLTLDWEN